MPLSSNSHQKHESTYFYWAWTELKSSETDNRNDSPSTIHEVVDHTVFCHIGHCLPQRFLLCLLTPWKPPNQLINLCQREYFTAISLRCYGILTTDFVHTKHMILQKNYAVCFEHLMPSSLYERNTSNVQVFNLSLNLVPYFISASIVNTTSFSNNGPPSYVKAWSHHRLTPLCFLPASYRVSRGSERYDFTLNTPIA